ncbi:hypothetical protein D6D13_02992 [Aureobasidium pullulans]|uniref:NAD(P)-binding protein n=1 Tax=Aureobasidium pullulans TaxID=5580 RepID=A0A4S9D336_AURPU|nr:hypothetical protein D6D13_02992 [Aureobasidium pullulans]
MLLPHTPWRHGATILKSQSIGPVSAIHALHSNRLQRKDNINSRIPSSRGSFLLRSITTHAAKDAMTTSSVLRTDSYLISNVKDLMSLQDRVVVITGGAKGIGLALAFGVAEAGGKIAIVDTSSKPSENYARLQKICSEVRYYQSDVTDHEKLTSTFDSITKDFKSIDGIITAAGICPDESFLDRDPSSVKKCIEVNVLGTYYAAQLAARQMVKQSARNESSGVGSIVMIASMAAHRASKAQFTSDYCMSKGGVLALTKQLGVELAHHAIRVNCISPGYIATDLIADLVKQRPTLGEVFQSEPPMKRMGNRTDLKAAAVYLLADASAYMTSGEMLITGGLHAGQVY